MDRNYHNLSLTPEEMTQIMQKMEEINIFESPDIFVVDVPPEPCYNDHTPIQPITSSAA
jgi:hypothetical protein